MPRFIPETYRPFWELNLARFRPIQTHAKKLISLVREAAAGSVPERINRVESLANDVLVPLGGDFADIGGVLVRNASRYVDECSVSYDMHADLIELWPELVKRCSAACGAVSARNM